jgi:putative CocE/NonD family hydrolase
MSARIVIDKNVAAVMRDGTVLRANVYRPEGAVDLPVLLTRLPYGKDFALATGFLDPVRAAESGYIVVVQDVRGRFASDGDFVPFLREFEDGYDTVEWAARLPGSNGRVGMFGASYFGMTQWQAAVMEPPHLAALCPAITWANYLNGTHRRGGAFEWGTAAYWTSSAVALEAVVRRWRNEPARLAEQLVAAVKRADSLSENGYGTLPLEAFGGMEELAPYFYEWMSAPIDGPLYAHLNIHPRWDRIHVPVFLLGGWYDIFCGETLAAYRALRDRGRTVRLMMGPWTHGLPSNVVGERDFGLAASAQLLNLREDLTGLQLRWFDAVLKGDPNGMMEEPPVWLFVMGENRWHAFGDWPVPKSRPWTLYLDSSGHARGRDGDGLLSPEPPTQRVPDRYVYDPADPVPTHGGALLMPGVFVPGPREQAPVESRRDVLCYTTAPLTRDTMVVGPVTVTLFAASSAPDTDFVARLVDVGPDGRAYNLADGIVRARYRDVDWNRPSSAAISPMRPGQVYRFTIDLWGTANLFRAGHRIRLQITSSNFPRWDRNPNTGLSSVDSAETEPALQTVFHDPERPSALTLWVVEP